MSEHKTTRRVGRLRRAWNNIRTFMIGLVPGSVKRWIHRRTTGEPIQCQVCGRALLWEERWFVDLKAGVFFCERHSGWES